MKTKAHLLKFTVKGHVIEAHNQHCSGYEDPESFVKPYHWWADAPGVMRQHWDGYEWPADGVPVIDIRKAVETPEGYSWVFKGPLLDVSLQDGEIDALPEVSPLMAPAIVAYGQAAALVETRRCQEQRKAGPLDGVSTAEFVRGWKEHGARIGRCFVNGNDGRIEWD